MNPQNADTQATILEQQAGSHGGPGRERLGADKLRSEADEAVVASRGLGQTIGDLVKTRGAVEQAIRDAAAVFYRELREGESKTSIVIIELLGPYIKAFRPADKDVMALVTDTNPQHLTARAQRVLRESGHPDIADPTTKTPKPGSPYRQYATVWRTLTDIQHGIWDRKVWEKVSPETINNLAVSGVIFEGKAYHDPISALRDGFGLRRVMNGFMDVLKPRAVDLNDIDASQQEVASAYARDLKVTVKVYNEDLGRHQATSVKIVSNAVTVTGAIYGILDEARKNKVMLHPEQMGLLFGALEAIEWKDEPAPEETPEETNADTKS